MKLFKVFCSNLLDTPGVNYTEKGTYLNLIEKHYE